MLEFSDISVSILACVLFTLMFAMMDVHRDFVIACIASTEKNPEIRAKYQQIKKRRGTKKARVAIDRRLLTAIHQMLLKDEPYAPFIAPAKESIPKSRVLSPEQALAMLRSKGYVIAEVAVQ